MPRSAARVETGASRRRPTTRCWGLLPDGSLEVLTVVNHPTEGAIAWEMELEALKERGVEQIDLIVSDALRGIEMRCVRLSHDAAPTLRRAFQTQGVEHRFHQRQSRGR